MLRQSLYAATTEPVAMEAVAVRLRFASGRCRC